MTTLPKIFSKFKIISNQSGFHFSNAEDLSMPEINYIIIFILNVNSVALLTFKTLPINQKRQNCSQALTPWRLLMVSVPIVSGGPTGNSIKLLIEQPGLPQESEEVEHEHQKHPGLSPSCWTPAPVLLQCPVEVTASRADEDDVGSYHGQDEKYKDLVVAPPNTVVEEEAVVVIIQNTNVTQTTVLAVVHLEQLQWESKTSTWIPLCLPYSK